MLQKVFVVVVEFAAPPGADNQKQARQVANAAPDLYNRRRNRSRSRHTSRGCIRALLLFPRHAHCFARIRAAARTLRFCAWKRFLTICAISS